MFRAFLILAAVLAATVAQAADRIIVVGPDGQQLADGKYWAIAIHADGTAPTVSLALEVGGVVPPPPPPVEGLTKAVVAEIEKVAANDARHAAAMKLTATYQMLAGQVRDGKIHPTNAVAAADMICPIALGADGKQAPWPAVFAVVNAAVGKAGTTEATAAVFDEAATATLSTVPASGDLEATAERYGFDWTSFLAFLMELLKILLPLIIS